MFSLFGDDSPAVERNNEILLCLEEMRAIKDEMQEICDTNINQYIGRAIMADSKAITRFILKNLVKENKDNHPNRLMWNHVAPAINSQSISVLGYLFLALASVQLTERQIKEFRHSATA